MAIAVTKRNRWRTDLLVKILALQTKQSQRNRTAFAFFLLSQLLQIEFRMASALHKIIAKQKIQQSRIREPEPNSLDKKCSVTLCWFFKHCDWFKILVEPIIKWLCQNWFIKSVPGMAHLRNPQCFHLACSA